jgi:hypothetical protein
VISPQSNKHFLSLLVNGKNFQQYLLESLESDEASFFLHEIMETFDVISRRQRQQQANHYIDGQRLEKPDKTLAHLAKALQKVEEEIPTSCFDEGSRLDSCQARWLRGGYIVVL